jgi:UDP-glucose 4-epimerase
VSSQATTAGRMLVTGAAGFVGRHALAPLLAAGADVHAVGRRRPEDQTGGIHWHDVDLLNQEARRALVAAVRPKLVLHLAWETAHGRYWTAPSNLDWVAATLELLHEASKAGAERFVGVGSCVEYQDGAAACNEMTSPIAPATLYGVCKDACRRAAEEFAATMGVSFAWARLFLLYGPGEKPTRLVPSIACKLLSGAVAPISSGLAIRDFMDVRDAGAALAAIAVSDVQGCVNVSSGIAVRVRDVAEQLGRLAGRPDLVQVGQVPDRNEPHRLVADIARLRNEVGYRGIRPLETGLLQALDYWRSRSHGAAQAAAELR